MEKIQLRSGLKHSRHVLKISWLHVLSVLFPDFLHVARRLGFLINQFRYIGQTLLLIIILTIFIHLQLAQDVAARHPSANHFRSSLELRNEGRSLRRKLALVDVLIHETIGFYFFQSQHAAAAALVVLVVAIADVDFCRIVETAPHGFYWVVALLVRIGVGRRVDQCRDEVVLLVLPLGLVELIDDAILIPTHRQLGG